MEQDVVDQAVAQLGAAVDTLLSADLPLLAGTAVTGLFSALESQRRRLESVDQRLIAEITTRGTAGQYARSTPASLLVDLVRISPREAKARVGRARDIGPRTSVQGEPLPPLFPLVAAAHHAGEISAAHADVITRAVTAIPHHRQGDCADLVEATLVEDSRHAHPGQVATAANALLARIDQDGTEPRDTEHQHRRDLTLRLHPDGSARISGRLTPAATAVWNTLLDALSAPQPADNGERDDRTPGQRRHDGLLDAGLRLIRSNTLPDSGGIPVTIIAHVNADDLNRYRAQHPADSGENTHDDRHCHERSDTSGDTDGPDTDDDGADDQCAPEECAANNRSGDYGTDNDWFETATPDGGVAGLGGSAVTAHGGLLSIAELLRLAGEADIMSVFLSATGGILSYGRTRRLASPGQRLVLAARDGGCCFPGCDRPPSWCQTHHLISWLHNGPTDICNLCLLCSFHHREFERRGWIVYMAEDGYPEWLPPLWLDPEQKPIRNTAHHHDITINADTLNATLRDITAQAEAEAAQHQAAQEHAEQEREAEERVAQEQAEQELAAQERAQAKATTEESAAKPDTG